MLAATFVACFSVQSPKAETKDIMRSYFILLVLTICCNIMQAQAQGRLVGQVRFADGEPAISAIVQLKELQAHAVTNVDGAFTMEALPYGSYTLEIASVESAPKHLELAVDKDRIALEVVLDRSVHALNEVVVSGQSVRNRIETQGFSVAAVETGDVAFQSVQANEMLDRTAGVRIRQGGGLGSRVDYNINGMSGNAVRVFIDGVPLANYGSSFSLSSIPPAMIERVEVYKGVVPAHLSDDALGGAINVVLRKEGRNSLSTSYSFGSFNTHQWNLNGSYRHDKSGFVLRGSGFYNYSDNNYKVWGDKIYVTGSDGKISYVEAERFHDRYRSGGLTLDAGFSEVDWADLFLVGLVRSAGDKQLQHGATMETVYGNRFSEQNNTLGKLSYQKDGLFVEGLDVSLYATYSKRTRNTIDTVPYIYNWLGNRVDLNGDGQWDQWASGAEGGQASLAETPEERYSLRSTVRYRFWRQHSLSFNFLRSHFTRRPDDPLRPQAERQFQDVRRLDKDVYGLTLESSWGTEGRFLSSLFYKQYQQQIALEEPIREGGVLRSFHYSKANREGGYGAAFSFKLMPRLTVLTSAEKAVRLPEHNEVFGNDAENIDSAYELKPERSLNANLGFYLGRFSWGPHRLYLQGNLFYRETRDMIRQAIASQHAETFAFENQDEVLSKGFDAELGYDYDRKLSAVVGVSSFNARFNKQYDQHGAQYIYYGDRLRNEPFFTMNAQVNYHLHDLLQRHSRTTLSANWAYVHEFYRDWASLGGANKAMVPTQSLVDVGLTHQMSDKRLALSLDAKNIFNQQAFDNWALQKPGRAFYVKITYTLL